MYYGPNNYRKDPEMCAHVRLHYNVVEYSMENKHVHDKYSIYTNVGTENYNPQGGRDVDGCAWGSKSSDVVQI